MANPDIYLLFGVARGGAVGGDSEKQIRSDLEDIINKINNDKLLKVKIGLDEKSVGSMKEQLETGLNLKGKKIAVKTELDTAALKGIQQQVSDMLTKLGETAASSESHLKGIVDLLSEINSKPFAANLNFSDANPGVESLGRYREAVRDYVREIREGHEAIAAIANHPLWKSNGLDDMFRSQIGALYGSGYDKEIPKFEKRLDASSSFAGVERVAKDALVYWKQLLPILTKAQEIGIISAESKFGVFPEIPKESVGVASQLVDLFTQITQKAQEAAAAAQPAAEQTAQALDGQRQAASAVSQEYEKQTDVMQTAATAAKNEAKERLANLTLYKQISDLAGKIRDALNKNQGSMGETAENAALEQEWERLNNIIVECGGNAEALGGVLKASGENGTVVVKEANVAMSNYNRVLKENAQAEREAADAEKQAAKDRKQAEKDAAAAEKQAAKERAQAEKEAAAAKRSEEQASKAATKANKEYYDQLNAVRTMLLRVQSDLNKYSAAKNGKSAGAYSDLERQVDELRKMEDVLIKTQRPIDNFQVGMGKVRTSVKGANDAIAEAGENTKSFSERFSGLTSKFGMWFSASRVFMAAVRAMRQMINTAIELDSAMNQMQIVTKATDSEMKAFASTASKTAKELGTSIQDFVNGATTYARLGYNSEESSILAKYTTMLQNVGNTDAETAQNAITAIIKAYDVDVSEIESIMDKLVKVGNNFPISVSQIAEGMNNVSSAMHAAGNDFDQTVALLTAANTTVQNISKSSTGLRTIAARIRNVKTELDDLGETMTTAEYDNLVQALTDAEVSLTDQNGELRNTYDIMADIARVWDDLDSNKRASLAETLAGTRQQNIFFSIVEQFKEASGAMDAMSKSAGSLQESYDTFMESMQAHINQFKAAFGELSQTVVSSKLVNVIVDIGTAIITLLNGVFTVVNGIISGFSQLTVSTKEYEDAAWSAEHAYQEIQSQIDKLLSSSEDLTEQEKARLGLLQEEEKILRDQVRQNYYQLYNDKYGPTADSLTPLQDQVQQLIRDYNTRAEQARNTSTNDYAQKMRFIEGAESARKQLIALKNDLEVFSDAMGSDFPLDAEEAIKAIGAFEVYLEGGDVALNQYHDAVNAARDGIVLFGQSVTETTGATDEIEQVISDADDTLNQLEEDANAAADAIEALAAAQKQFSVSLGVDALQKYVDSVSKYGPSSYEALEASKALEAAMPGLVGQIYDLDTGAINVSRSLLYDADSLIDLYETQKRIDFSDTINGLEEMRTKAVNAAIAINSLIPGLESVFNNVAIASNAYYDTRIHQVTGDFDDYIKGLRAALEESRELAAEKEAGAKSTEKEVKEVDLELERLKSIVALRKEELSFLEASGDTTENQVAKMREIQKSLHDQAEHMRGVLSTMVAQGATQAEINAQEESILSLSTEWWKIQNDINELLHDDVDTLSVYKDRISLLKAELDFMEARGDADSDRILKMREIQAALHEEAEAIRATEAYTKGEASALQSVVELGTEWWNLQNKIKELSEETLANEKELLENMKSGMDKVLSLVIELIKKQKDDEVQALEDQKTAYRQIIDLRKKALDQSKTEAKYQKDIAKQLESMAELQRKINSLDLDDSREAQNEKAKLRKELEERQESLAETQADHAIDAQEESLDKMQYAFEEEKDNEIKVVKDSVSSYQKLYDLAIDYIDKNWDSLYDDLIRWNTEYGSELNSTITSAWDECLKAAERYGSYVEALNNIDYDIANADTKASSGTQRTVASYVSEMKQNSNEWNRRYNEGVAAGRDPAEMRRELNNSDEIKRLHARNIEIMNILRGDPYNLPIEYDEAHGKYYIVENGVRNELYTKYPQYHSGGIVEGRPSAKQDEVLALLKNGETVLTERQGEAMYRIVDIFATLGDKLGKFIDGSRVKSIFASPLPQARFASAIDAINANGSGGTTIEHMEITAPIYVSEKLDEEDIRRHARTIGATAAEYIREGFTKRNVTGPVFGM